MVLITDNAPYHHKREINPLESLPKKKLMEMMITHEVEYLDLPLASSGRLDLAILDADESHPDVQERGDHIRIERKADE